MKKFVVLSALLALIPAGAMAQDAAAGKEKAAVCGACHGVDGNSTIVQNPILAGQTSRYLYLQLKDFKEGRRQNPLMSPMAANLSRKDMFDLAAYYSAQKPTNQNSRGDASKAGRGKQVADAALCTMCHLGGFSGQNEVPRTAGQHYEYVLKQLMDFKTRARSNDAGNMTSIAATLSDADIENLSQYIGNLY